MSLDKLVDSTQLDSDLTSVANAIRAKSGGSSSLAFPAGFVSEIQAIPTGGDDSLEKFLRGTLGDYSNENVTTIGAYAFYRYAGGAENLRFPNATSIGTSAFYLSNIGPVFFAPKASLNSDCFYGAPNIQVCVSKASNFNGNSRTFGKYAGTHKLATVDFTGPSTFGICGKMFENANLFNTLILRGSSIFKLYATSAFTGTPFASGGTGGTIYIPKALYDHLGDGTADDYKAATNWSTINGYGTITWAKIEGSIYENAYADGTPIT